jgi:hypothetical protein
VLAHAYNVLVILNAHHVLILIILISHSAGIVGKIVHSAKLLLSNTIYKLCAWLVSPICMPCWLTNANSVFKLLIIVLLVLALLFVCHVPMDISWLIANAIKSSKAWVLSILCCFVLRG